jgi:hypothetical protein
MKPDLLKNFETVILPESEVLSDEVANTIKEWVHNGGTLIATGRCGLLHEDRKPRKNFALAEVLGADFISEERKYAYDPDGKFKEGVIQTYLESTGHPLTKSLSESTVGSSGAFLRIRKRSGATEILRYRLPFMVEDLPHNKWFNWGPPPPGTETAGPAGIYNKFGKGQSIYIGAPIFQEMSERMFWVQDWIPSLMRTLVPNPVVELSTSSLKKHVHGTFFYDRTKRFVLLQLLNSIELSTGAEFIDVPHVDVSWDPHRLVVTAAKMMWPKEQELSLKTASTRKGIRIQTPGRYAALYLKLG